MSSDMNDTTPRQTGVSVDHFLAGLAVWAVAMVVFVLLL